MDVFALLFIVSFLASLVTLAVMYVRKRIKTKDNAAKGSESTELHDEGKMYNNIIGKTSYVRPYDIDTSWHQKEVNDAQEKWKETLPKHSTRIKLRNSRKLRNKRKGKNK